jgi:HlyD family secretion protein
MTSKIAAALGILIAAAGISSGRSAAGGGKDSPKYRTAAVTRGDIMAVVATTGLLAPVTLVEVGAEVSGQIVKVNVDFNSPVKKGEIIAELDRTPFEDAVKQADASLRVAAAALDKAKLDLDLAKKKYDRTLDLYEKKLVSQDEKETEEAAYLEAKNGAQVAESGTRESAAELESSRIDLAKTQIRSPIGGIVLTRNITVGQTVAASFEAPVLFTIADDLRKMRLQLDVDEADVGRVTEGQKVEFTVEAFPTEVFTGRVLQVQEDAEVDSDVVRYPTVCELDNAQNKLRPGMTATVTVYTGEVHGVLRVPNAALRFVPPVVTAPMAEFVRKAAKDMPQNQSPSIVWTLDQKGRLTPVVLELGMVGHDFTEVAGGELKEGQTIVTGVISGS